jgi:hypothetical protein
MPTGAGTTLRTIFIAGNNDRAANARTSNNVAAARRMSQHHVRTRSDVMTPLERIGRDLSTVADLARPFSAA